MIELTKKYRIIWDELTLNIRNDYLKDYTKTVTKIVNPEKLRLITFESDNYQDILNKVNELGLHPIGEWVDYEDI